MKITRNIFIILYAILLVINDPQVARAHTIEGIGISQAGIIENKPVYVDPYGISYYLYSEWRREQHFQP